MMRKLNYWNVKKYKTEKDKKVCENAFNKEIELKVDEYGRVFDEAGIYIADIDYQKNSEY